MGVATALKMDYSNFFEKKMGQNLHGIKKVANFASLLKTTRGVAQLVRVRVWGA